MPLFAQTPIPINTTGPIPIFYCNTLPKAYHFDEYHNCARDPMCWEEPIDIEAINVTVCIDKVDSKTNSITYCIYVIDFETNSITEYCELIVNSPNNQQPNNQQPNNNNPNILSGNILQYQSNNPAQFLLLLDSKQLCLVTGNFQCVVLSKINLQHLVSLQHMIQ